MVDVCADVGKRKRGERKVAIQAGYHSRDRLL